MSIATYTVATSIYGIPGSYLGVVMTSTAAPGILTSKLSINNLPSDSGQEVETMDR